MSLYVLGRPWSLVEFKSVVVLRLSREWLKLAQERRRRNLSEADSADVAVGKN